MRLPVATVTAATAAPATAAATSAVTSASATAVTPAMATTAAATTASTFALRTRFVDDECAAQKFTPVECRDDLFGFRVVPNLGESETARLACEPIAKQSERIRLHARFRK
jgi:hypothetical protein